MPTISVPQSLLRFLMEQRGFEHNVAQVNDQLPLLGTDIDGCTEEQLDIEIFPDRPDLLSGETLAVAMANFLHGAPAKPMLDIETSEITMDVDVSLKTIRPVIYGTVVKVSHCPRTTKRLNASSRDSWTIKRNFTLLLAEDVEEPPLAYTTLRNLHHPSEYVLFRRATNSFPLHVKTPCQFRTFLPTTQRVLTTLISSKEWTDFRSS